MSLVSAPVYVHLVYLCKIQLKDASLSVQLDLPNLQLDIVLLDALVILKPSAMIKFVTIAASMQVIISMLITQPTCVFLPVLLMFLILMIHSQETALLGVQMDISQKLSIELAHPHVWLDLLLTISHDHVLAPAPLQPSKLMDSPTLINVYEFVLQVCSQEMIRRNV